MAGVLDVAIVGAGPAGLAASLYLKREGHRVRILERFETAAPVGSGLILQPTGLTVLADLDLFERIMALGARIDRLFGADADSGRTVLDVRYDARAGGRFGLAVHRAALFSVLHDAVLAQNIPIETGIDIAGIEASASRAALVGAKGERLGPFDLVVDASGARSRLRASARRPSEPVPLAYGAFWASLPFPAMGFERAALTQRYRRASVMVGVLPIGRPRPGDGDMAAFFWSLKPAEADMVRKRGLAAWKEAVLDVWPECVAFTDAIDSFEHLTLARYGHHTLRQPIGERMAVIGDAAHSTSPQLGQGANMALLDAAALGRALATQRDISAALEAYAASRRRHVRLFQALSWMFTPFYQSDSSLLPFLRDRLVASIARIPPAPQFLAAMVAGTLVDPFEGAGLKEVDWRLDASAKAPAAI